ncbi:MAG TPA: CHAT domain-containing protein [Acidimicrobiales bacterium]
MAELQAGAAPVTVGGVRLSSDAVSATVEPEAVRRGSRPSLILSALEDAGLRADHAVALDARRIDPDVVAARGATRGGPSGSLVGGAPGEVVVDVPAPPPGRGQVLLVENNGAVSWSFPQDPFAAAAGRRGRGDPSARQRFVVPVAPTGDDVPGTRGIIGAVVRRVLRVLTFDLIDKVAGEVSDHFVSRWEEKTRPHRIRSFAPQDYKEQNVAPLDAAALRSLAEGPALFLIHGTNSLIHSGFAAFHEDTVRSMHDRYQGRVFGFDHPTLSVNPLDNCKALAALLPDGLTLDVDILCHSRGGLVARSLVELAEPAGTSGKLRVRQVVFVATPNRGTPLADPERLGSLLDGLTNLLDLVPDNPVTDSLNGIVTVVRQLAVGALKGLDGLTSMRFVKAQDDGAASTNGPAAAAGTFLGMLNQPRQAITRYRAIAADFEPAPESGLAMVARDKLVDALFGFEPNDLIVPTASAFSWNGGPGFPVADRLVLPPSRGVDHSSFWTTPEVVETLATWLSPDDAAVRAAPVRVVAPSATAAAPLAGSLDEVDERFAAGDLDGVRRAIATLPPAQFDELRRLVGDVALLDLADRGGGPPEQKDGTVFVVPGVMGSHLDAPDGDERDHIWLNPLRLVAGEMLRLRVMNGSRNGRAAGGVRSAGLYRSYMPIVLALDERWNVVPVSYDWRLPLRTAADSLARTIRDHFNGRVGPAHIVCHSMGGLVARMLIAGHPDVWNAIDSPKDRAKGGRLVMLGTPNRGSFSIGLAFTGDDKLVRWLAALDMVNSKADLLRVLASFPGLYELLTAPDAGPDDSDTAKLYDAASWPDGLLDGALLAEAKATHAVLASKGFDRERMYYVAGSGHETPDAVKVGPNGSLRYRITRAGDGRVPHSLGLADKSGGPLFPGRTWYTEADHGELTTDGRVVRAVDAILRDGATTLLRDTRPPGHGPRSSQDGKWLPAALVEPAEPVGPDVVAGAALRSPTTSRSERRAAFQQAAATAVSSWLGTPPATASTAPVLRVRVLHASLEHSSYPVLVGHYRGDPIRGAEGFLDWRLEGQLSRRQAVERYPREIGDVLRITTDGGSPVGGIVVGLGGSGELTPTGLAAAVRDAALEHALEWLERPDERMVVSEGAIGITSVLLGSYGAIGMSLPASVAAIVEGVVLANALLAERNVDDKVRIADLELVERYSAPAEEAARVVRQVADQLPTAVRSLVTLAPDQWLSTGEGRRPAVPTSDYGAGMWHRLIVSTTNLDAEGRWVRLHYTSLGSRARADQLVQDVDTRIIGRMLQDAVTRTSVDGSLNVALFEILFHNDIKRELAAVENVQLVLDARAADLPWEALTDRGALTGQRPLIHNAGLLRQLSIPTTGRADPSSGTGAALVVGDPPGPRSFGRLDGARREAREVAEQLGRRLAVTARIFDASSAPPDSATQVLSALMAEDYQVVHIAAHGHFEPPRGRRPAEIGEPAEPGTAEDLPGEPNTAPVGGVVIGPGESEYLTASMFRNMRRPPDLVFLNCCHLGSVGATVIDDPDAPPPMAFARKRTNELAASLARELMSMGVKAVVAAGWSVSDKPAAAFAYRFYERMTAGSMFGEAVRSARNAAFAADGGASNTWAAYQCYGDPAFRLFAGEGDARPSPPPVSADELIRRLEDITVQAGDAGADRRADLLDQTANLEERARELWSEGRVWSTLGDAYRGLTSYEPAVRCYRKALEVRDSEVLIGSVEQLAYCEHRLAMEMVAGRTKIVGLDKPNTPAALRAKAEERITALDALGPSAERHVLRGGLFKQDARMSTGEERKKALKRAAEEYAAAWRIDGKNYGAFVALQLNRLGAPLPARTRSDLEAHLRRREAPAVVTSFWDRAELGDFLLTSALVDGTIGEKVDTIAAAYVRAFAERSLPSNRASVTNHIDQLAEIAPSRWKPTLQRLHRHLVDWRPQLAQS